MKRIRTFHVSHSFLLALFAAGATTVACSKPEEKSAAWSCHAADVPMGEVIRCTQSAVTMDGPAVDSTSTGGTGGSDSTTISLTDTSVTGGAADGTISYECTSGET